MNLVDLNSLLKKYKSPKDIIANETLSELLIEEALLRLSEAIVLGVKEFKLFTLAKDGFDIIVPHNQYAYLMDSILRFYESREDYEKCDKISKLFKKL